MFRKIEIRLDEESFIWLTLLSDIKRTHQRYYDKQVEKGIRKKDPEYKKDDQETWTWKGQIYVPARTELRKRVIAWCHEMPLAGHPGIAKTLELTMREFWWPNMKHDIEKYVKGCHECQRSKPD